MSPDAAIAVVASGQHGAFTHRQARDAGFSRHGIRHRVATGRWLILHRGVYAIAGVPFTREREIFAAVASYGRTAVASGPTAAEVLGLLEQPVTSIDVTLPPGQRRASRDEITVHQVALTRSDVRTVRAIRVTAPNRTLVDLAPAALLEEALDTALFRGLTSVAAVARYIAERNLSHRPGVGRLRRILDDRLLGTSHSKLERIFFEKLKACGLPLPTRQYRVGGRYIDISYPSERIIIELDGHSSRFTAAALRDDRRRQNEIVLALPGWTLLRFTWDDVAANWPGVERTLRRVLSAT